MYNIFIFQMRVNQKGMCCGPVIGSFEAKNSGIGIHFYWKVSVIGVYFHLEFSGIGVDCCTKNSGNGC